MSINEPTATRASRRRMVPTSAALCALALSGCLGGAAPHAPSPMPLDAAVAGADLGVGGAGGDSWDGAAPVGDGAASDAGHAAADLGAPTAGDADGPGVFVAVGYGGRHIRSVDDGLHWVDDASNVSNGGDDDQLLRTVVWGDQQFLAIGYRAMTSTDGKQWVDHGTSLGTGQWFGAVVFAAGGFVGVGGYGMKAWSPTGLAWMTSSIDNVAAHAHDGLAYGALLGGRYVASNDSGQRSYSSDGKSWHASQGQAQAASSEVAFGNGVFVALGGDAAVVSSDGGATWTAAAGALGSACGGLVFAQGRFTIACQSQVFRSSKGVDWSGSSAAGLRAGALVYGHGTYLLLDTSTQSLLRSADAISWSAPLAIPTGSGNSLEWITFGPTG